MKILSTFIMAFIFVFCVVLMARPTSAEQTANCQKIERFEPTVSTIERILASENVPVEFAWLAIAESGGRPDAVSRKGAAGLWQLMPATARRYGLIVNSKQDDRFDIEKSTHAAAKYLRHLLEDFHGDWSWAIAAYNAGGHNIRGYYQRGAKIGVLKSDYPEAYMLSVAVMRLIKSCVEVDDDRRG